MNPSRNPSRRSRVQMCSVEILESRIAPAVTLTLTGIAPNFAVAISDDASGKTDNTVEIHLNGAGELEYSLNGGAFTNDLDSTVAGTQSATIANIQSIAANLGIDSDTFIVSHTGGLVNPHGALTFDGGSGGGSNTLIVNGTTGADTAMLTNGTLTLNGRSHGFANADNVTFDGGAGADSLTVNAIQLSLAGGLTANAETMTFGGSLVTGGAITLSVDALDVQGSINAGAHRVTIQTSTAGRAINLGTEDAAQLSITDGELDKITAGVVQIGGATSGALSVSAAMTPAGTNTLVLMTGAGISETGSITVANLRVESGGSAILAGNVLNDVSTFAGRVTGNTGILSFRDDTGFAIGTVDGVAGVAVSFGNVANGIAFRAGTVTQTAGANVLAPQLLLLGSGPYTLNNSGNDVNLIGGIVAGPLQFTDANALTVGAAFGGAGLQVGNNFNPGLSRLRTLDGDLTIAVTPSAADLTADFDITLTAESGPGQDHAVVIAGSISGSATIVADHFVLTGSTMFTTVEPFTPGTLIDLGGADAPNTLGLTNAELAGVTSVGSATSGQIRITAPITPPSTVGNGSAFSLIAGAGIVEVGTGSITSAEISISGSGNVVLDGPNHVDALVANVTDGFLFSNAAGVPLKIDKTFSQVGIHAGDSLVLKADALDIVKPLVAGKVTLQPVSAAVPVSVGIEAAGAFSISPAELALISAPVLQVGGPQSGDITLNGSIGQPGGTLSLVSGAAIGGVGTLHVANLRLQSVNSVALNGSNDVDTLAAQVSGNAQNFIFNDIDDLIIGTVDGVSGVSGGSGAASVVALIAGATTQTPGGNIRGGQLQLFGAGPFTLNNTGNDVLAIAANVTGAVSYTDANALTLGTSGLGVVTTNSPISIVTIDGDLTVLDNILGADVSAGSGSVSLAAGSAAGQSRALTLNANAGVTATGGVSLIAKGPLAINAAVSSGAGGGVLGNAAATFTAGAALSVAFNSAGQAPITVTGTVNLGGAALAATLGYVPGPFDSLVVLSNDGNDPVVGTFAGLAEGATVTLGGVDFKISYHGGDGNDVVLSRGTPPQTFTANLAGTAPNLAVTFNDGITGNPDTTLEVRLNGSSQIEFSVNGGAFTNDLDSTTPGVQPAAIADIQSIAANLGSGNDAFIVSHTGGLVNPHGALTFDGGSGVNSFTVNGTGGDDTATLTNGTLTLNGRAHSFGSVANVTFNGGAGVDALTLNALTLTGGLSAKAETIIVSGVVVAGNDVTLSADTLDVQQTINAGTHRVTLQPATDGRTINLGTEDAAQLSITDGELDKITASVVQIGGTASGAVSVSAAITPAGTSTLALVSGAGIAETGSLTVSNLRIESSGPATLSGANDVSNLAAHVTGGALTFNDVNNLNVAAVDGLNATSTTGSTLTAGAALTINSSLGLGASGGLLGNTAASFGGAATLALALTGPGQTPLAITGTVDLAGATLAVTLGYTPGANDTIVIVSNDGSDPVVGTFAGLAEGATVAIGGTDFKISYHGGDGNDVVLTHIVPVEVTITGNGKVAKFIDVDGDQVKITTTKSKFTPADFQIVRSGLGGQLQFINLSDDNGKFAGADITITATPTTAGGDGFVNVGYLNSAGAALGNVFIAGDLGRFDAGSLVQSLKVQSLGALGTSTQDAGGSLASHVAGTLEKLVVRSDIRDASLTASGRIGIARVLGSFIGGKLSAGLDLGSLNVGGGIAGSAASPVVISAVGVGGAAVPTLDLAIGSIHVGGSVEFLRILAGYDSAGIGKNADASIGSIAVGADWRASTALAGVGAGPDGFEGTSDDKVLAGAGVQNRPGSISKIASIVIGGRALGSIAAGDNFGIRAEKIGEARIGGVALPFTPGAHGAADFFLVGGTGPGAIGARTDFAIGEVIG